ncbi:hypothetical protein LIER_31131 [Lithospermum erythrorhizon]|uniref:Uncharacterized protein n=1 Tax=Lithospermum erythrorhizon TaxID=34254 RepID=A0AAV3RTQ4_LITER
MAMSYNKPLMHKVAPLFRNEERSNKIYDPLVVSLGPYHHGKLELQLAQRYKSTAVQLFVSRSGQTIEFFQNKILEVIDDVRSCYFEGSTDNFSDSELAEMMLQDSCFLLNYIELCKGSDDIRKTRIYTSMINHLDRLTLNLTLRDLFLLENQIPYSILTLLMYLRYGTSKGEAMLSKFISGTIFGDERERMKFSLDRQPPVHLLDAYRQVLVAECLDINNQQTNSYISSRFEPFRRKLFGNKQKDENNEEGHNAYLFRSLTDLKTKGVRFKLSNSYSLRDIKFASYCFYAELQLPYWCVSIYTKVFFSNMIAYENCLEAHTSSVVTAYVSFMKALIQNSNDVKLLRERKIIVNQFGSDEEALQVFDDLNSFALGELDNWVFEEVKKKIHQHCNSKSRTWMEELIHTYFRSPWTTIAFIAAVFLLCLAFIQAYFTVNPSSEK